MDLKYALEKLEDNPELAKPLEETVQNKVETSEFYGILADAGVDA